MCAILASLAVTVAAISLGRAPARIGPKWLIDRFGGRDRLVTSENAYWGASRRRKPRSRLWLVTSGTLFVRGGWGWTGLPDGRRPDRCSCTATGSAVFRMTSRRQDFRDVAVSFELRNVGYSATPRTPARPSDGVHVILRWASERATYYLSVNRRDGSIVIKRKLPGGPANGGTYTTLTAPVRTVQPLGVTQHVVASVRNLARGRVSIDLVIGGRRVLRAIDSSPGALTAPGRVGLRGDNDEFYVDDFVAKPLAPE